MSKTRELIILLGVLLVGLMFLPVAGMPYNTMSFTAAQSDPYIPCNQQTSIPTAECEALIAIYDATNGPNWSNNTGWLVYPDPCFWSGVSCFNGNVTTLTLSSRNMVGDIPSEVGNLSNLVWLNLSNNQLKTLPTGIGNLSNLSDLDLRQNQLTLLPSEIVNLSNLTSLNLSNNQLASLPLGLNQLSALNSLTLSSNQLTAIPSEIGQLTSLSQLDLIDNPLSGSLPNFLTTLTLQTFRFYQTNLCTPNDTVKNWLGTITSLHGTGYECNVTPGAISGVVTLTNGDPAVDVVVVLYREILTHISASFKGVVTSVKTNNAGEYTFSNLGEDIKYFVYVNPGNINLPPKYYDEKTTLNSATVISVTNETTTSGIDFVLNPPQPAVANVTASTGSIMVNPLNGELIVTQRNGSRSAITVTRTVLCADSSTPTSVNLLLGSISYVMSSTGNTNEYSATIPEAEIASGSLQVVATCPSGSEGTDIGTITLFDPSGYITDSATGAPVVGATVTLYRVPDWRAQTSTSDMAAKTCESNLSKASETDWSQPAPTTLGEIVNTDVTVVDPLINPQTTNSVGYYGWDVPAGCWYVVVTAEGYYTLVSPVVGVPPEVTDLDLKITKIGTVGYAPIVTK